uniref:Zinc-finger domain-containing protein n=1 Tax=Erythrolobus madagascarensis TaxID=708628 RepID=A0A7S0XKD3_9RHOD|mmetsp:Transcript_571/g.1107  ORF Transcript_571/g.1107 Transcript_571/m.1107 type:complete len:394 (+) Transcript_571:136-1317(+)
MEEKKDREERRKGVYQKGLQSTAAAAAFGGGGSRGGQGGGSSGGQSASPLLGLLRSRSSMRSDELSIDLAGLGVLSSGDEHDKSAEALQRMCDDKLFLEHVEQLSRTMTGEQDNLESAGVGEAAVVDVHQQYAIHQIDPATAGATAFGAQYSQEARGEHQYAETPQHIDVAGRATTSPYRDAIDATFEKLNQELASQQRREAAAAPENDPQSSNPAQHRNSSGDSGRETAGSPRRSMSSGGAATPLRGVARTHSGASKRSSGTYSRFCHVCSRKGRKVQFAVCANFFVDGRCRKVICDRCLEVNGSRYAETVTNLTWTCFHCNNRCPPNARCKIYTRPSGLAAAASSSTASAQRAQQASPASDRILPESTEMRDAASPGESGTDLNDIPDAFY